MNEMPNFMPNFMPYNETMPSKTDIEKTLANINRELEQIEKRLAVIENALNNKNTGYLSSNVDKGFGHYMI